VLDFAALKQLMRRLTQELDHRVLLPRDNPKLAITEEHGSVKVAFDGDPRYVFPVRDVLILPIPNTTVEMLAEYLAGRIRAELTAVTVTAIEVEVEENFGQAASYRETLD
jgi:6-pyruvoyltetrahydropterin/6-carboxytetrahydropterin synthase